MDNDRDIAAGSLTWLTELVKGHPRPEDEGRRFADIIRDLDPEDHHDGPRAS